MSWRFRLVPLVLLLTVSVPAVVAHDPVDEIGGPAGDPCGAEPLANAPELQACDHGGQGAMSCETRWVVNVGGWGSVSSCGISCDTGYYACCQDPTIVKRALCYCVQEWVRIPTGPWTPESPGL